MLKRVQRSWRRRSAAKGSASCRWRAAGSEVFTPTFGEATLQDLDLYRERGRVKFTWVPLTSDALAACFTLQAWPVVTFNALQDHELKAVPRH